MTSNFRAVSTVCSRPTSRTPNTLSTVKTPTTAQAMSWASAKWRVSGPSGIARPASLRPRYADMANAAAAIGAENPAKKLIQPLMKPQAGPQASVR